MTTGSELLDVVSELGALEWGRCSRLDDPEHPSRPPLSVWRFVGAMPDVEASIEQAVHAFQGQVRWTMWRDARNWVVQPEAVATYSRREEFNNDVELAIAFARENPDIVRRAFADLPLLAQHIAQRARVRG